MKSKLLNQLLIITALSACYTNSKAEGTQQPLPSSNAIAIAQQAGTIAGAASACGQDVTLLTQRVGEAINTLAKSNAEKIYAEQTYRSSMVTGQVKQNNNPAYPCPQVIQDYNNLPILRADYQQSVMPNLTQGLGSNNLPNTNMAAPQNLVPTAPAYGNQPIQPAGAMPPPGFNQPTNPYAPTSGSTSPSSMPPTSNGNFQPVHHSYHQAANSNNNPFQTTVPAQQYVAAPTANFAP